MRTLYGKALPLLIFSALSAPAMAQDAPLSFDGPYIGGFVGVGNQSGNNNETVSFDTNRDGQFNDTVRTVAGADAFSPGFCNGFSTANAPGSCQKDGNGINYGVKLGYDKRVGSSFVIGALIEANDDNSDDGVSAFSTTPAGYSFNRSVNYAISARARAGFAPGERVLVYGTGGVSYAKLNHEFFTTNAANSFTPTRANDMVWGYQVGGGAEFMLTDKISIGAEYLYNRYKDDKYFVAIGPGTAAATNPFLLNGGGTNFRPSNTNFDFHAIRASINFQF